MKTYFKHSCGKSLISGITVTQHRDYSFSWDTTEYVSKMVKIDIPRGFTSTTEKLDEATMSKVEAVNGQIGWLGGSGRPDLAAAQSIIPGCYKDASPDLVSLCNSCVQSAKEVNVALRI